MTAMIGWDTAVADAHEGIREEMLRQVLRGEIYISTRNVWHRWVEERTPLYGYFPPITDETLDRILDELLEAGAIAVNRARSTWGLNPVVIAR